MVQKKKRMSFNLMREVFDLTKLYKDLPNDDEVFKAISEGHFSSIAFVKFVSQRTNINYMLAATLRVGKKHLKILDDLHTSGKIVDCDFICGSIMKNDSELGKSYNYYSDLESVCKKNNWNIHILNNHSKVILFDTDIGKYVLETSSNLNENPNIEQFSFEKDANLYNAYIDAYKKLMKGE